MGLIEEIKQLFDADDLYQVLDVDKKASSSQLKKAFRKKSLAWHPDKTNEENRDEFTKKFQALSKCYDTLQDDDKRKVYDETGCVDDESSEGCKDWMEYWRNLFPRVSAKDIDDFMETYIGSDKERKDLIKNYKKCKGDMNKILEYHVGYTIDEEGRISKLLKEMIDAGEIEDYAAFSKETDASKRKRRQKLEEEKAQSEKMKKSMKSEDDLVLMLRRNQEKRASDSEKFLAELEAKFAPKPKRRATGSKKSK